MPVLIHAGRGLPPGMPLQLGHVAERYPDASLILAHAAIVAQAGVGKLARSVENIFFDSSTWTPLDQLNLMSLVPPEQILWASDIPYGEPLAALNVFVRSARVSGAGDDLLRGMLRDNALALLEGRRPATRSAPLAKPEFSTSYARIRATMYMAGATSLLWLNQREIVGYLGMAEAALVEEGLERQAELVRCAQRGLGRVGRDDRPRRAAGHRRPRPRLAAAQPGPGRHAARMSEVALTLNGRAWSGSVPEGTTLAELLREHVGLTGTKIACAEGTCGSCTVLVDGRAVLSCILLAPQAEGCDVTTIEGLGDEGSLSPLQRAFVEEDALQCGFCTGGQVVVRDRAAGRQPAPDERARCGTAMSGNLCRCGAYPGIERAVLRAAAEGGRLMAKLQKTSVEMEGRYEDRWVLVEDEPPGWEDDRELTVAGTRVARLTGPRRVSGAARYVSDIALPAMLQGVVVRSPHAHATVELDVEAARAVPGVHAVLSAADDGVKQGKRPIFTAEPAYAGAPVAALACEDDAAATAPRSRRSRRATRSSASSSIPRRRSPSSACRRIPSRRRPATSRPAWPRRTPSSRSSTPPPRRCSTRSSRTARSRSGSATSCTCTSRRRASGTPARSSRARSGSIPTACT